VTDWCQYKFINLFFCTRSYAINTCMDHQHRALAARSSTTPDLVSVLYMFHANSGSAGPPNAMLSVSSSLSLRVIGALDQVDIIL
jgi:hypothetical protein